MGGLAGGNWRGGRCRIREREGDTGAVREGDLREIGIRRELKGCIRNCTLRRDT